MNGQNTPLQAVIFDQNQVLLEYDHRAGAAFFADLLPISYQMMGAYWEQWKAKVGMPTSLSEEKSFWVGFWQWLCDELGVVGETRDKVAAFSYVSILRPYPDARPALKTVQEVDLKVGVLSNFSFASLHEALTQVNLGDLVDVAISSTTIGVAKPEAAAYQHMTEALGVPPEACLFFDNKLSHVNGAQAVGMAAYQVDRKRTAHNFEEGVICNLTAVSQLIRHMQVLVVNEVV
ncbi:MAG: HAD-IA family hydrolase [Chloroflexi bacterium]|nr:HAD-IA family hydrolase [Chloroflexota bacterium]